MLLSQVPPAHTTGELTALLESSSDPMAAEFLAARAEKDKALQKKLKAEMAAGGKWEVLLSSLSAQTNSSPPFRYPGFPTAAAAGRDLVGSDGYLCSAEFLHFEQGAPTASVGPAEASGAASAEALAAAVAPAVGPSQTDQQNEQGRELSAEGVVYQSHESWPTTPVQPP